MSVVVPGAPGILTSLCNDANPVVHTHALHALYLVVEAAGLMFQPHVNAILALVAKLYHSDAHGLPSELAETVTAPYEWCVSITSIADT